MEAINTSLIISTYNWPEALKLVLLSIENQSISPSEVIIADDGSTEETKNLLENFKNRLSVPLIHIWHKDEGFRLAAIRNKAIAASQYEYVISIDGDVILHRNFIEDHIRNAKKGFFVAGSRVLLGQHTSNRLLKNNILPKASFFTKDTGNRINSIRCPWVNNLLNTTDDNIYKVRGCNMAFWREDLITVNGFDGSYEGWGREDTDIVVRLFNSGITKHKIKFALIVYHIFHNEASRENLSTNDDRLEAVIREKRIRAIDGIV